MEYKDFEKLYRGDPVIFHLALDILMGSGRNAIESFSDQTLRAKAARQLSGLFSDEKINAAVKAVRDLAGLKNMDLLAYTSRCGIKLEDDPVNEPGVCPLCGGTLEYLLPMRNVDLIRNWHCTNCGAKGKEAYRKVFDSHYNLLDSDGHMVHRQNFKK